MIKILSCPRLIAIQRPFSGDPVWSRWVAMHRWIRQRNRPFRYGSFGAGRAASHRPATAGGSRSKRGPLGSLGDRTLISGSICIPENQTRQFTNPEHRMWDQEIVLTSVGPRWRGGLRRESRLFFRRWMRRQTADSRGQSRYFAGESTSAPGSAIRPTVLGSK